MTSTIKQRIGGILSLAYAQDWNDDSFSLQKAQVCAELSSIVYEDVREHELKRASRIHLFASDAFREIVKMGKEKAILEQVSDADLEAKFFIVRSRYAVIFGTLFNNILILAVKGTVPLRLWDWKANLDTEKYHLKAVRFEFLPVELGTAELDLQYFHKGFFESIIPQFASISDEIKRLSSSNQNLNVVWTGHSLGGAMAAIGYAIHSAQGRAVSLAYNVPGKAICAYTFGMPRYCGLGVVCGFSGPYHIYRKADLVPTLPLRKMGFSDSNREYELTDSGTVAPTERADFFGIGGHVPRLFSSLKAHHIEGYAELLAKATRQSRP